MKNKKSVWSTLILVITIINLIMAIVEIISVIQSMPKIEAYAREAAIEAGIYEETMIELVVSTTKSSVIAGLSFSLVFTGLIALGGFLFSLKGKWGMFCIVVGIISLIGGVFTVINAVSTNGTEPLTIALNIISLCLTLVYVFACFKHRSENLELE